MSAHTPGPWVITDTRGMYSGDKKYRHSIVGGPQGTICTVADNVRNEADARLIAAAPALLEALERIANDHNDGRVPDHRTYDHLQSIARDALKRIV